MHILAEPVFIAFTYTKWRPSEFESGGGGTRPASSAGKKLCPALHFFGSKYN